MNSLARPVLVIFTRFMVLIRINLLYMFCLAQKERLELDQWNLAPSIHMILKKYNSKIIGLQAVLLLLRQQTIRTTSFDQRAFLYLFD